MRLRSCYLLMIALVGIVAPFRAEGVDYPDLQLNNTNAILGYHQTEDFYFVLLQDSFWMLPPEEPTTWQKRPYRSNDLPADFPISKLNLLKGDSTLYLVDGGIGQVYVFEEGSIRRIDNSFSQMNQFSSCQFWYDGKIMAYGGYGLFSHKPFMTAFSVETKEWDLWLYGEDSPVPPERQDALFQIQRADHTLYIAHGARRLRPWQEGVVNERLEDVWELNLKTKNWTHLGTIKSDLVQYLNRKWHLQLDQQIASLSHVEYCLLDLRNNQCDCYSNSSLVSNLSRQFSPDINPNDGMVISGMTVKGVDDRKPYVRIFPLESLMLGQSRSFQIYRPTRPWLRYLGAGVLLLLLVPGSYLLLRRYRASQQTHLWFDQKRGQVYFQNRRLHFQPDELKVLFALHRASDFVSNQELLNLLQNGLEQTEVIKKRKIKLIQEINSIVRHATGEETPLIEARKDPSDQRFKEYRIHPEWR